MTIDNDDVVVDDLSYRGNMNALQRTELGPSSTPYNVDSAPLAYFQTLYLLNDTTADAYNFANEFAEEYCEGLRIDVANYISKNGYLQELMSDEYIQFYYGDTLSHLTKHGQQWKYVCEMWKSTSSPKNSRLHFNSVGILAIAMCENRSITIVPDEGCVLFYPINDCDAHDDETGIGLMRSELCPGAFECSVGDMAFIPAEGLEEDAVVLRWDGVYHYWCTAPYIIVSDLKVRKISFTPRY